MPGPGLGACHHPDLILSWILLHFAGTIMAHLSLLSAFYCICACFPTKDSPPLLPVLYCEKPAFNPHPMPMPMHCLPLYLYPLSLNVWSDHFSLSLVLSISCFLCLFYSPYSGSPECLFTQCSLKLSIAGKWEWGGDRRNWKSMQIGPAVNVFNPSRELGSFKQSLIWSFPPQ